MMLATKAFILSNLRHCLWQLCQSHQLSRVFLNLKVGMAAIDVLTQFR